MPSNFWPWPATAKRCAILLRFRLHGVAALAALLLQACVQSPPQVFDGANPADPDVRAPPASYRPVLGGYVSQRPVSPSPWIERNRQVTPPPAKGGQ